MMTRIAIVVVLAAVVALVFSFGKWTALRRARRATTAHGWDGADFGDSAVTVVLFTGPRCTQCDAQRTAIAAARVDRTDVGYVEINAGTETALARRLAVLSVPTTVIVDSAGSVLFRNGRLVDRSVLTQQLDRAFARAVL